MRIITALMGIIISVYFVIYLFWFCTNLTHIECTCFQVINIIDLFLVFGVNSYTNALMH